jgi:hypothetical protein
MNTDEQTLIDGLFSRLKQAESDTAPRDAQADARIKEHVASQPAAPYYMAQAILVQEAAIKRLSEQNKQLQEQLTKAQAQAPAAPSSGGFLSSIFGGGSRDQAPAPSSGGWREPGRPAYNQQPAPQQNYAAPPPSYAPPAPQAPAGGGFMRGALQTAAGVAGGVMLAEGISSLFHHDTQPQEIVEIIKEEPAAASDDSWNQGGQEHMPGNESWANNDPGGFANSDLDGGDGGGFFDDDEFV